MEFTIPGPGASVDQKLDFLIQLSVSTQLPERDQATQEHRQPSGASQQKSYHQNYGHTTGGGGERGQGGLRPRHQANPG